MEMDYIEIVIHVSIFFLWHYILFKVNPRGLGKYWGVLESNGGSWKVIMESHTKHPLEKLIIIT